MNYKKQCNKVRCLRMYSTNNTLFILQKDNRYSTKIERELVMTYSHHNQIFYNKKIGI